MVTDGRKHAGDGQYRLEACSSQNRLQEDLKVTLDADEKLVGLGIDQ